MCEGIGTDTRVSYVEKTSFRKIVPVSSAVKQKSSSHRRSFVDRSVKRTRGGQSHDIHGDTLRENIGKQRTTKPKSRKRAGIFSKGSRVRTNPESIG